MHPVLGFRQRAWARGHPAIRRGVPGSQAARDPSTVSPEGPDVTLCCSLAQSDGQGQYGDHVEELQQHPVRPRTGATEGKPEKHPSDRAAKRLPHVCHRHVLHMKTTENATVCRCHVTQTSSVSRFALLSTHSFRPLKREHLGETKGTSAAIAATSESGRGPGSSAAVARLRLRLTTFRFVHLQSNG